ncbi:2-oxo-3-hexenedioate decarboxylase [Zoogloea sp.]|jgi:2-oxo-3-hexenedioate decarboxylase|uniref:2-oxo-3-hexenedioate decarboxylase n=1 Tax=Zoogloea sp. TaxID=49181 RepID=UPI001B55D983|nr:2-oxo-3-hexenedioate decarboxylase [Zoogloea sp.]MBK7847716.1 2-oxo-3-hexenedioate decarboxylase [Zoogloea sp.]MBP7444677.1 2-oxo-3-hexenedioate decarboxylase [Zoogloea sp.]HOY00761.1 2-oxo-3-hexenedioate decarboxylase [Zoogloea sp.]HPI62071.1 2-oxo-3-hexenedioate decarboxylase [Zoogloea sp.]
MNLDNATILKLADHLETAELKAYDVTKITDDHPDMDWDDAYAIQDEIRRRKEGRGNKTVGLKAGLTSFAKMKQMGVEVPVFGFVSDYMSSPDGADIKTSELIHPKVEAEICVVTKAPLSGPGCHLGAVMAAIDFVVPAVEIIDSRYRDFKFDLKSVIADNTSASRFVVGGRPRNLDELDLRTLGVVMEKNGGIVAMAAGAAVLGHPLAAVVMLANHLGARGQEIPAGTFIMTGGVTEAIAVQAGDNVAVRFQDLGTVSMRFV